MRMHRDASRVMALCAALLSINVMALDAAPAIAPGSTAIAPGSTAIAPGSTAIPPGSTAVAPSAGINSVSAAPVVANAPAPSAGTAPAAATAPLSPEAGIPLDESGAGGMSSDAVAGIPLEDGGELVLGPEEKVSSDDHKQAAERFAHMRKDGKLAASSDLDREVPRILKREQAGDIRGALQSARAALARMPNHENLRQITARLQVANGDFGSALLTLAPLLEIDRDNWLPFYWAGVAELMQLNLDNARAYLARACQLDAERAEPWIARAVVEQEAGNFAGSLQLFNVARQRSPARAEILNGIAYSQAMLEQTKGQMQRPPSPGAAAAPEAIVSQPPAQIAPMANGTNTNRRMKVSPQSFRNSPTLATGMGFAARAILP